MFVSILHNANILRRRVDFFNQNCQHFLFFITRVAEWMS